MLQNEQWLSLFNDYEFALYVDGEKLTEQLGTYSAVLAEHARQRVFLNLGQEALFVCHLVASRWGLQRGDSGHFLISDITSDDFNLSNVHVKVQPSRAGLRAAVPAT